MQLPRRWADRLAHEWRRMAEELAGKGKTHGLADMWLKRRLEELAAGRRAGLHPATDDAKLCKMAENQARAYADRMAAVEGTTRRRLAGQDADHIARATERLQAVTARHMMSLDGMADLWPEGAGMTRRGKLRRLCVPEFWRRAFRKMHARTLEQCAIAMGLVRSDGDNYLSRESRGLYAQRQAKNAAMLRHTVAVNEYGDERTLQSLAEISTANPTIRRGELMTRVSGFEACADALGHVKRWAVLTCPSRMHKWLTLGNGKAVPNKRYDGTKPRDAQQYLAKQWRRVCAHWERQGLRVYGFRTTEPHQDGCPHWNVLCFFAPMTAEVKLKTRVKPPRDAVEVFDAGLLRYFLKNDSATEPGAAQHRVKLEAIDSSKGSAASYIAKYISKGIDGAGLEVDLWGNPIETTASAIVAWARVWGIRQFQQIGGPPVSVWRELRKLHPDNMADDMPEAMRLALEAVNLGKTEPEEKRAVAWQRYTEAQGGPTCKRRALRVHLLRAERSGVNRYGEPAIARVVGVRGEGVAVVPPEAVGAWAVAKGHSFTRRLVGAVESERADWVVAPMGAVLEAFDEQCQRLAVRLKDHDDKAALQAAQRMAQMQRHSEAVERLREALPPWTRVNNCTSLSLTPTLDSVDRRPPPSLFSPKRVHRAKVGRFFNWKSGRSGDSTEGKEHATVEST